MRIAFVSDIHGNFTAFEAVVEDIRKNEVDEIICLGDVATLGPQPNESIDLLQTLNCKHITGNHESALFDMQNAGIFKIAPPVIPVLEWCKKKLISSEIDFLKSFKPKFELAVNSENLILCYHGSPENNTVNILPDTPYNELEIFFTDFPHQLFIGGHTHIQMLRPYNGKLVVNSGSVGIPFMNNPQSGKTPRALPWAEYAIIDVQKNDIKVELKRVNYNVSKLVHILKKSDLPLKEWWFEQLIPTDRSYLLT